MDKLSKIIKAKPIIFILWFGLSLFHVVKSVVLGHSHIHNNYFVFKYNFLHVIHQQNLYLEYPENYYDLNHYGPVFAFVMAPFAILPDSVGVILWVIFTSWILLKAIQLLPIKHEQYLLILLLCAHELMTSAASVQSNPIIVALIILSFVFIKKEQDFWGALMIALGMFVKLYGVVGLAFFFFSNHKIKLIGSLIFWSVVLFLLPMAISSPAFIVQTYKDWLADLLYKNNNNESSLMSDISFLGFIRKTTGLYINVLYGCAVAGVLLLMALLRTKMHAIKAYQLLILSYVLLCVVLFNTNVESPTYIIGFVGVAIWFIVVEKNSYTYFLLIFALVLTSLSPSDLFPAYIRNTYVIPYALKAVPCILIWFDITYRLLFTTFKNTPSLDTGHA
ncbi:MAG: DUF2029 domain-containing protein [Sphingobacteriaceae bacterium]|nr:MAG: DUF2029 domain-containing protein [Sphingobacteriaceae bacterium]